MQPAPRDRTTLASTLFLASALASFAGAGALLPVALRSFSLVGGATALPGTAFFASVAIGVIAAALWERGSGVPARPALAGMALRQCLAAIALAVAPVLFRGGCAVYFRVWPVLGGTTAGDWVVRSALALTLVALPAAVLAATLFSLARIGREEGGTNATAAGFAGGMAFSGLAIGAACGGLALLPNLGLRSTWLVGVGLAGVGAALGVICMRLVPAQASRYAPDLAGTDESATPGARPQGTWNIMRLVAALAAGAGTAAAVVVWSRTVALLAGPTEAGLSAVLVTVALGAALGGWLAAGVPGTTDTRGTAILLVLVAAAVHVSMHLMPSIAIRALHIAPRLAATGDSFLLGAIVAGVLALPGAVAAGWAIAALAAGSGPGGAHPQGADRGADHRLATTLGWVACGAAVGSLVTVAGLVPALGLRRTAAVAAAAFAVGAAALAFALPLRSPVSRAAAILVPLVLAGVFVSFPAAWDPRVVAGGIYRYGASAPERFGSTDRWLDGRLRGAAPLFYREGREVVVVVEQSIQSTAGLAPIDTTTLTVDGRSVAGTGTDLRTQVLTGTIPVILHGPATKGLLIEMLSGVTAGSMLRHPLDALTVIEREPAMAEAAALFGPLANDPLKDARLKVIHDDPRARLGADRSRYDVIVLAAGDPWLPYASGLMTREGYALIRSRLAEGGLFAQRVSLGAFTPGSLPVLLRTFAAAFPSVLVFQLTPDDLLLAGSERPLTLDGSWLRNVVGSNAGVAEDLGRAVVIGANEVVMTLRLDREALLKVAGAGADDDDDRATVQRAAASDLRVQRDDAILRAIDAAWPGFGTLLANYGTTDQEKSDFLYSLAKSYLGITADPVRALDLARELRGLGAEARSRWVTGEGLLQQKDFDGAVREWEGVLALEPDNLDALFSLGTFYLDGRDDRRAERYLARAAAGHPGAGIVHYHYGRVLFNLGRFSEAIEELRRARSLGSGGDAYPLVDYLVGLASARLNKDGDAITALRAYLAWAYAQDMLTRVEVDAHLKLAEVLERTGKRFDALQERQKGERLLKRIEAWGRMQQQSAGGTPPSGGPAPSAGGPAPAPDNAAPSPGGTAPPAAPGGTPAGPAPAASPRDPAAPAKDGR